LIPVGGSGLPRPLGIDRGRVVIAADFDAPLPEETIAAVQAYLARPASVQPKDEAAQRTEEGQCEHGR
jgi:hypothetical protein